MAIDGALKVPVSAVFPLPEAPGAAAGPMAVFAVVDRRARQTAVEVGHAMDPRPGSSRA